MNTLTLIIIMITFMIIYIVTIRNNPTCPNIIGVTLFFLCMIVWFLLLFLTGMRLTTRFVIGLLMLTIIKIIVTEIVINIIITIRTIIIRITVVVIAIIKI